MTGKITRIISKVKRENGWVVTALVDGDEVTGWAQNRDDYMVGQEVYTYFHDKYNKPKMSPKKP